MNEYLHEQEHNEGGENNGHSSRNVHGGQSKTQSAEKAELNQFLKNKKGGKPNLEIGKGQQRLNNGYQTDVPMPRDWNRVDDSMELGLL